ncbi:MAG: hypothetical protein OXE49_09215 [Gemmatimonadetes bacterium]|nr:hypothetical protein [Gemmatimonadota bacterium]
MLQALVPHPYPIHRGRPALELLHTGQAIGRTWAFSNTPCARAKCSAWCGAAVEADLPLAERPQLIKSRRRSPERVDRAADPDCRELVAELTDLILDGGIRPKSRRGWKRDRPIST